MQAKKQIESLEIRRATVRRTTDLLQAVFTLALHREGFGKERIKRINGYVDEIIDEYTAMQEDDVDYADAKLREAVRKVMGDAD